METTANLPLSSIIIDKDANPRKRNLEIGALAESIKQDGQISPVLVEPHPEHKDK